MKIIKEKFYSIVVALIITIMGVFAVLPSKENPFEEAITAFLVKQDFDREDIELINASYTSVLLVNEARLTVKAEDKTYFAVLTKWPLMGYKLKQIKILSETKIAS